ncbi:S66 peptidase family protein [Microlunatus soli]|nr:LD-carboxypeptidase [Microlunatus soli]
MSVPRLQAGDRVRLLSPASTPDEDLVARGVALLRQWGLQVEIGQHAFDRAGYLAGNDPDRLADLNDALRDPNIRAIFATRGGKGAYRIAAKLDFEAARRDPKPLVGFSDITYLHLALHCAGAPVGFHGPAASWSDDYYDTECAEALHRALTVDEPIVVRSNPTDYTATLTAGNPATGVLVGGNLDSLAHSVGWALPDLNGAILLIEGNSGTGLGQVDRCLAQLTNSGQLDNIAGVAVGTFGEFETATAGGQTLAGVLADWFAKLAVPVLGGLPIGHGRNPVTVPLGTTTTIDPRSATMTVTPGVH